ncbi:MAG: RDD family protein [Methanofollis sp.]|nr:RDD family protein [Methanofollis sp.]
MYCQTCGEPLPDDSLYCSSCGRRIGTAALQAEEEPVEYAGFIKRLVANFFDNIVILVLFFLLLIVLGAFAGIGAALLQTTPSFIYDDKAFTIFTLVLLALCTYFYRACLESSSWQATLGKRALGAVVTDTDGKRLTFRRATARFIGKFLSEFVFPVFIVIAVTQKKQGLHDMAAGTLVVKKRR